MRWGLVITSPAGRGLRKVPRADLEHINDALDEMCADPYSGDIKFLRGASGPTFRRRVGDWRILFELDKKQQSIVVLAVRRRGSKTY